MVSSDRPAGRTGLGERQQLGVIVAERNAADLAKHVEQRVAVGVDDVVADALRHVGEEVRRARVLDRVHVPARRRAVGESETRGDGTEIVKKYEQDILDFNNEIRTARVTEDVA